MGCSARLVDGQVNRRLKMALVIAASMVLAMVVLLTLETYLIDWGDW
jgi:hypothetical protein